MGSKRSQSARIEDVALVGGPCCGMTYALPPDEEIVRIEVPCPDKKPASHWYERDGGLLFYYTGTVLDEEI